MNSMNDKIICIVGPTASGKTDLAFDLSHIFPGEVVNADSKQVYAGIDIIPGKDLPSDAVFVPSQVQVDPKYKIGFFTFDEVRIWLLDIVQPTQDFSVHDYVQVTPPVLSHIQDNNRIPIIVGGSGFYVKALLDGIETLSIPQDIQLRAELSDFTVDNLQKLLKKEDEVRLSEMNISDKQNKRRLIRAIEVARFQKENTVKDTYLGLKADVRVVGLQVDREEVKKRIDRRIEQRIKQGALDEAQKLFDQRNSLSTTVMLMNGIKPLFSFFEGNLSQQEAIEQWRRSEYLNAKKQMTWFKKDPRIIWYDVSDKLYKQKISEDLREWLGYENRTEY